MIVNPKIDDKLRDATRTEIKFINEGGFKFTSFAEILIAYILSHGNVN